MKHRIDAAKKGRNGKRSRAIQRVFTVTLDKATATRLDAFCWEFRGIIPEAVIAEAAFTQMESAETDFDFRYNSSLGARDRLRGRAGREHSEDVAKLRTR